MRLTGYVAGILLCRHCKHGGKICYSSGDIEVFLGHCFHWRGLYIDDVVKTANSHQNV